MVDHLPFPRPPAGTVGVLLAAGGGTRFTGSTHKLLALLDGRPIYEHALAAASGARFAHLVVVTGAVELRLDRTAAGDTSVVECHHGGWADGQATSVQAGLAAARGLGATAVVVGLADQPFVTSEAWAAVAGAGAPIAVATYDGVRGNPVRLAAQVWPLLPATGDAGARRVMKLRPELVEEVPCKGSPADIDTLLDLERWT